VRIWHIMAAVAASAFLATFLVARDPVSHWLGAYGFIGLTSSWLACEIAGLFCVWQASFREFAAVALLWPLAPLAAPWLLWTVWHDGHPGA
jgi:hypothetical protein